MKCFFCLLAFLSLGIHNVFAGDFFGKYEKNFNSSVEFISEANHLAIFRLHIPNCHIEGAAQWMDAFHARFTNGDCFLVFQFTADFQSVKIASKSCVKTCGAELSKILDGQYSKK